MKIQTKYHGEIDIEEKDILRFIKGIPGFPDEKKFILLGLPEQDMFSIMQSVNTPDLAFVLTSPFRFIEKYEFTLDEHTLEQLEIENQEDISIFSIVTIQDPFEKTTTNLQAPIILNVKNNQAKQVILNDTEYKIKHSLFEKAVKG
ncbi:flagellar assembly protein FliW [Heyndrickxia oleronia]|jgi:flagellar assembly factor FliW|uniref:flagellar assembly protein FliW n=1 Tax=Heyndrickxia oleronia TaxID=38875 RepID=UPI00242C7F7A|nr:flagellar assembly protein FliW [Heyndrickxia oleronia]MCI1592501.1 flagellar assembly protein FliW [Heyndrickxia oleronia]MCI1615397.1 flagellar assembly protein FliW [Heyndrickxia oleronia]MCI1746205.1 flagellar assembly protein FliW [Heyndrickxia oleronia]MCI1763687.1 flagellar assembly protein FliW [Heyndrickxia oleronia]